MMYVLYDERGIADPDRASVLEAFEAKSDTLAEAIADENWAGMGWALYRADQSPHADADPIATHRSAARGEEGGSHG